MIMQQHLKDYIEALKNHLGFKLFTVEVTQLAQYSFDPAYRISFDYNLSIDRDAKEKQTVEDICKPIFKDVENSDLVKQLTSDYLSQVSKLTATVETLQKEVERLKPFETYYNLHYKMSHGEEIKGGIDKADS